MGSTSLRHEAWKWQAWRECGQKFRSGWRDRLYSVLYSSVKTAKTWECGQCIGTSPSHNPGGIFNFDFSNDGSILVAACERKSILLFDPLNAKLIGTKDNAHNDCVNCVRFLDSRTFVTCSDDTTVSIWDVRNMKQCVRTLRGHSNWVKNVEYDSSNGLLVTSGFDGSIYTWDVNKAGELRPRPSKTKDIRIGSCGTPYQWRTQQQFSPGYSDSDNPFQRVFHTNGLMRTRLSPDNSKLITATAGGYLMVIHNLNLSTLARDLMGFKPNMYRLMQMSKSPIRQGYMYNHVFTRKRNRVELISDFPQENDAEMIASLQVHPHGWCVLSRNTNNDENTEWTCIHDIQGEGHVRDQMTNLSIPNSGSNSRSSSPHGHDPGGEGTSQPHSHYSATLPVSEPSSRSSSPSFMLSIDMVDSEPSSPSLSPSSSGRQTNHARSERSPVLGQLNQYSDSEDIESHDNEPHSELTGTHELSPPTASHTTDHGYNRRLSPRTNPFPDRDSMTFIIRSGPQVSEKTLLLLGPGQVKTEQIYKNRPRLTHYVEEPNVGRGFIKEVSFSSDGRIVASPYAYGVRLLGFSSVCSELCDTVSDTPVALHEIACNMSHKNVVVATKFSPTHCLLVTGCLSGKVDFHQPRL